MAKLTGVDVTLAGVTMTGNVTVGDAVTDTIGFYGVTAVNQPASSDQAVYTQTAVTDISGHNTTNIIARINQIIDDLQGQSTLVHEIRGQLVSLGLIKGAA